MKAIKIVEPGKVQVEELNEPQIKPDDILIHITSLGLCGSDLSTYRGNNPMVSYPIIPGHEIAGEIVSLGKDVPGDFSLGLPVTVSPYSSCGSCSSCRIGRVNCCKFNQTMGVGRDGAAAEYISVPFKKVFCTNGLNEEQTACIEPLSVGWHATNRAMVAEDEHVVVFGCGVVGLGAVAAAAYKGTHVIAVDIDNGKLEKAGLMGARDLINSTSEDIKRRIYEITSGKGPDAVIEAVGLPQTFVAAVDLVCFAGRVVYIGYVKTPVEFDTKLFVSKELDIRGSRNALDREIQEVISMLSSGSVDVSPLITHRYKLQEAEEALRFWDQYTSDVTKILLMA